MLTELRNRWSMSRDMLKLSCLRYRDYEGYFASMHQSGNHWMRHLLGTAIALRYGHPAPEHLADMRLIGEPKCPPTIPGIPRLVFSHKICSTLVHSAIPRAMVKFPRYVIMVRDLRTMLVSHFERFKDRYQMSFSQFLRGDVSGRQFDCDIWDSIRFLNAWGKVCERLPKQTMVLRFEDLRADVISESVRVWNFLNLPPIERAIFEQAAAASTKDKMKTKEERVRKHGTVVRADGGDPLMQYSPKDRLFLMETCARYLRYSFGYDYTWFESAAVASPLRRAA
jgi:hypothetical protein